MAEAKRIKFATDLVTFYAPSFWGGTGDLDAIGDLFSWGTWDPPRFWERVLDSAREAGLDGIEITFPPGDWHSALAAYGSASGFATAVRQRGLEVCSGFLSSRRPGTSHYLDLADPDEQRELAEIASGYAEFLAACGSEVMVMGLLLRRSRDADPPLFIDLRLAEKIVDGLHRIGAATLKHGVRFALHPEAFTMFRSARDVDLFLTLTDPTYVAFCPDTAQFAVAGSDPIEIVRRHRDRVVLTHWKDATGPAPADVPIDDTIWARQAQWFAEVGTGIVDWPAWMRLLREMRYTGWAVFELDGAPNPVVELQRIRRYVETALGPIYR